MSNYNETNYSNLDPLTPVETESISTAAPAIRQIKQVLKNDGGTGYANWLLDESTKFKAGLLDIFKDFLQQFYPVGSYYITGNPDIDPNNVFGFGAWYQLDSDGYLYCVGSNSKDNFKNAVYNDGETYGVNIGLQNVAGSIITDTIKPGSSTAQPVVREINLSYPPQMKQYFSINENNNNFYILPPTSCCYVWYRAE